MKGAAATINVVTQAERSRVQHSKNITWIKLYWRLKLAFVNKVN